jgi:two-component system KDP operon response regulator KdpE
MPKQKKIMIVDDDPNLVKALRIRLTANEYEIVIARDGYEAITQANKENPDLVVLDLGLPAGDGFVVLERLSNLGRLADIPVIVLSARDPSNNEGRALKAGAVAYFQKPADNAQLMRAIRSSLGQTSTAGQAVLND